MTFTTSTYGLCCMTMFDKQLGWLFEKKVLNDRKKYTCMNSTTEIHMLLQPTIAMVGHHTYKFSIQNILRTFYDGCDPKLLTSIHQTGGKKWSILMTPKCGVNHCTTFSQNMFIPIPPRDIMLCHHLSRSIHTYKHPMVWAFF